MPASLVRGKWVIAKVTERDEPVVVEDGAVLQEDGTIVAVGAYADLAARLRGGETLGSPEHVVFPGLVNGHHHVGLTPLQLGAPDLPLELWLAARSAARDVDPYLDTLYSAFEMLASGVTTVQHLHGMRRGPVSAWPERARAVLRAYRDVGMRVSYAFGIRDQNQIVYGDDTAFARTLPPAIGPEIEAWLASTRIPIDDWARDLFVDLWEREGRRNLAERVRIWLAPTNLHWCSDGLLRRVKELAARHGVGIHIHLLETVYQKLYAHRRFGVSAVRHLHDLGFLGPEVTLGHGVWLTEEDIDLVAAAGTAICTNASSNLRLQSGIAPLNAWAARGLPVAMGIDEAGLNDDRDMLQEMRLVLKLHRVPGHGARVPTAGQVFRMATEHGAHTTGFAGRIGALEAGRAADLVVMRLRNVTGPYLDAAVPPLDAVLHRGRSADVDTVMVAGEVVLRDGRPTRVDRDAVLRELADRLQVPRSLDEVRREELARALVPHVRRFYADWALPKAEPHYTVNQTA
jgi:cytosine/adenosine deaminase-related metal-dependent hydrolase